MLISLIFCPGVIALDFGQQSEILDEEVVGSGIIAGRVYGLPLDLSGPIRLADAKVILISVDLEGNFGFVYAMATSDSQGYYYFNGVPLNRYAILAIKSGYIPAFRTIKLTWLRPLRFNVNLYMIQMGGATEGYYKYVSQAMEMIPEDQQVLFNGFCIEELQTQNGLFTQITFKQ